MTELNEVVVKLTAISALGSSQRFLATREFSCQGQFAHLELTIDSSGDAILGGAQLYCLEFSFFLICLALDSGFALLFIVPTIWMPIDFR